MHVLKIIFLTLGFLMIPSLIVWLCNRVKCFGKIGPILILYILGMFVGSLKILPQEMPAVQNVLTLIIIPLSIPMLLFSCSFHVKDIKMQLKSILIGLLSVVLAVIFGYLIFGANIQDAPQIGGMLTGVYTGGTINLAAVKTMLGVKNETYILLNSYDMLISFAYLVFVMGIGINLSRMLLPETQTVTTKEDQQRLDEDIEKAHAGAFKWLSSWHGAEQLVILLCLSISISGISLFLGKLVPKSAFMVVYILSITSLGIIMSFNKNVKKLEYSYDIGMYGIYIFSFVVASMADFSHLDLANQGYVFGYMITVVFGSMLIQLALAQIFKIDADTMVITSVALINSPPFVPMVVGAMKNRNVLIVGLTAGIIGYALGNYLGVFMAWLLGLF